MENEALLKDGTVLALKEHTEEMKVYVKEMMMFRYTLIAVVMLLLVIMAWLMATNRIGYTLSVLRAVAHSGCVCQ
jgi:hypothetical protein